MKEEQAVSITIIRILCVIILLVFHESSALYLLSVTSSQYSINKGFKHNFILLKEYARKNESSQSMVLECLQSELYRDLIAKHQLALYILTNNVQEKKEFKKFEKNHDLKQFNVNFTYHISGRKVYEYETLLIRAVRSNNYPAVYYLIKWGADVNLSDSEGFTPSGYAKDLKMRQLLHSQKKKKKRNVFINSK